MTSTSLLRRGHLLALSEALALAKRLRGLYRLQVDIGLSTSPEVRARLVESLQAMLMHQEAAAAKNLHATPSAEEGLAKALLATISPEPATGGVAVAVSSKPVGVAQGGDRSELEDDGKQHGCPPTPQQARSRL